MAKASLPPDVMLVAGLLVQKDSKAGAMITHCERLWGRVSLRSDITPFTYTGFYEKEMGPQLQRLFVAFKQLVSPDALRGAKIRSNGLEEILSVEGKRIVNIDPGYLDLSKLVVASTKDATYRTYLGKGIYVQPMLRFEHGTFRPWHWTYPDYRAESTITFFNRARESYKEIRNMRRGIED